MDLLSLPVVMIENILSYLSYDEIAKNRLVCRAFNELSMRMLNRGFLMIERRHALALKSVKAQLPRRESERRPQGHFYKSESTSFHKRRPLLRRKPKETQQYHPLARHCDILTSIETRISMLNMTYSKFIDSGVCCFIPGKVIDEIRRVLYIAETMKSPPRAHEVLQELRDISSMAIEHFDDKISPALRQRLQQAQAQPARSSHVFTPLAIRQEVTTLRRRSVLNAKLSLYLANQYKRYHNKTGTQQCELFGGRLRYIVFQLQQMIEYQKIAWRQRAIIRRMLQRQRRQEAAIAELKRRMDECDVRYSELIHKPSVPAITAGGESPPPAAELRHFSSQIKLDLSLLPIGTSRARRMLPNMRPRKPMIRLPSLSSDSPPSPPTAAAPGPPRARAAPRRAPPASAAATLAKIRGITNQIRHLNNLSRDIEGRARNKRPYSAQDDVDEVKKMKMD